MFLMILMDGELETTFFMTGCGWDLLVELSYKWNFAKILLKWIIYY